jgi:hypothetical protein
VLAVLAGTLALGGTDARACTLWVSDRGADGNPGSAEAPFRNVQKLVDSLAPGQVGCLVPGSVFAEAVRIQQPGIHLRTAPGRRATIRGGIRVLPGADRVLISSLVIEGADVGQPGTVVVEANGVRILRNDISGPFLWNRNVACVYLGHAHRTLVAGNTIHHCTRATIGALYAAGVVLAHASATTIRSNFIFRTPGDGIALAPDAQGSLVHNNVIDGNRGGVFFGGDATTASRDNRVVDNVVSFSWRYNVHASYLAGQPVGVNNLVTGNCLWRGTLGNVAGAGFQATGNPVADPRYVNRAVGFAMRPGPCYLDRPLPQAASRYAVLPQFRVRYRLRALRRLVQVVRLEIVNLPAGTPVDLRCVRRCRAGERLLAGRAGTASSITLRGRWLRRGAVLEVRTRKPWWVGHYARITVTGLPRGVRIEHGCLTPSETPTLVPCARFR